MARQLPKCCGCVPLKPGLLAWAYIRLVLAITSIGLYLYFYWSFLKYYRYRGGVVSFFVLQQIAPLPASLVYLLFTIIFIIGVHRENSKLLLVFLVYSILEVISAAVVVLWQLIYFMDQMYYLRHSEDYENELHGLIDYPTFYLRLIGPVMVNILLPIYFMVLINRELKFLKISRGGTRVVFDQPVADQRQKI